MHKEALSNLVKIDNGFAFKSHEYTDSGARIIRIGNVQKGEIVDTNPQFYPVDKLSGLDNYRLFEDDLLMSLTGNVGRVGKFPKKMLPAYLNQRVCRISSKSDRLFDRYLYHFLNNDGFEKKAIKSSRGVAQLNLSTKWVEQQQIPLPPLTEQKRIADILDKADALRKKNNELLDAYDELLKATFLDMFGDPVTNPKGWEVISVSKLSEVQGGIQLTSKRKSLEKQVPYLRVANVYRNKLELSEIKEMGVTEMEFNKTLLKEDDILIVEGHGNKNEIGRCAIWDGSIAGCIHQNHLIRVRVNDSITACFLSYFINSEGGRRQMFKTSNTTSGLNTISTGKVKKMLCPIPPFELQNQFAQIVANIEAQKSLVKQSLQESEDLFNALVQKAFKGELK